MTKTTPADLPLRGPARDAGRSALVDAILESPERPAVDVPVRTARELLRDACDTAWRIMDVVPLTADVARELVRGCQGENAPLWGVWQQHLDAALAEFDARLRDAGRGRGAVLAALEAAAWPSRFAVDVDEYHQDFEERFAAAVRRRARELSR